MAYFGHRSKWAGGTKGARGPFNMAPPGGGQMTRGGSYGMPSRPKSGFQRMVPSGTAGGHARVPNTGHNFGPHGPSKGQIAAWQWAAQQAGPIGRQARRMLRMFGLFGFALSAYEFYEWYTKPEVPWSWDPRGWTRCATPTQACQDTWGPPTHIRYGSNGGSICGNPQVGSCPTGQAHNTDPLNSAPAAGENSVRLLRQTSATPRYTIFGRYDRLNATVTPDYPRYTPAEPAVTRGSTGDGTPDPAIETTVSYGRRTPDDRRRGGTPLWGEPAIEVSVEVGGNPGSGTGTGENTGSRSRNRPRVGGEPLVRGGGSSETPTVTVTRPDDGEHWNLPNRPGERKWKYGRWGGTAGDILGLLSEFRDFMDCANKGIPGNPCPRYLPYHLRVLCIMKNIDRADPGKVETCAMENNAKDFALGKWGRMGARAFGRAGADGYHGRPVGPGFGGWGRRMQGF